MDNVGVVILSRYSSKRLPGKALIKINGKEVLKYVIERLERLFKKKSLVIATSKDASDDIIEKFAIEENIDCYRGSLDDVALRFYEAASSKGWKYAVRINGDNIFANIEALNSMLKVLNRKKYDFITNVKDRTFPIGMSVEIVRLEYYKNILDKIEESNRYKENVTLYLYEKDKCGKHYHFLNNKVLKAAGLQLALDTPDDLYRTQKIIDEFTQPHWKYNLKEIYKIWEKLSNEKSI